jgi:spermidine dehydrogenase
MVRVNHEDRIGLDQPITRRDFLNATLIGAGGALLDSQAPDQLLAGQLATGRDDWYGYGGTGDYAASHGNTPEVVSVAHDIRDGRYDRPAADLIETRETFDLVIVGGGLAGLGAAYQFHKTRRKGQTCLILDNHPIFGGEAKGNEFLVNGQRLIGPQGSNDFGVPQIPPGSSATRDARRSRPLVTNLFAELKIPTEFTYQSWNERFKPLRFATDNYGPMMWTDHSASVGHFFDEDSHRVKPQWVVDLWDGRIDEAPLPERVRRDFLKWRTSAERPHHGNDFAQWLDSMTYKDYLEKVMGLGPEVTAYADPLVAGALGLGCDVTSAYTCFLLLMPGVKAFAPPYGEYPTLHSFPGGNAGFARYFAKFLNPDAIRGQYIFEDIMNGRVNFLALDRPGKAIRMRLSASAVRVEHAGSPLRSDHVLVTYVKAGKTYRLKARGVVMAAGGCINRYVVRDLPPDHREAYQHFQYAPILVVNVALTNWRFMYKLGVTACRWWGGFGFFCNIRRPMIIGDYRPPLDPEQPAVLTFYVTFCHPGLTAREQGSRGRGELLSTSFREYERQIRVQMVRLFGMAGFDPRKDIAGIILNRWGHAYVCPQPGFHFGRDGQPAPRDVIRQRFGRIAFGHSELEGHQNWVGAISNGMRAAKQAMEVL